MKLTVANWFEQLPRLPESERSRGREMFMKMRPFLNAAGKAHFDRVFADG